MFITVAVATAGRRDTISELLNLLAQQTRLPDLVAICPAGLEDVDEAACTASPLQVEVIRGPRGLTSQRNALLDAMTQSDLIIFFDDDFVPASTYVAECEAVFARDDAVAMVTGHVMADGILGPGLTLEEAERIISADTAPRPGMITPIYNGYGCNMSVRSALVRKSRLRFDETLPLYGWLEDVDFSRGLADYGLIMKADQCRGVHRGVKRGRNSGIKFGYSQIANPIYLMRKGRMSPSRALAQLTRNVAQNLVRSARPEPWVDRKGRLEGNLMGFKDLVRGRLSPANIVRLP